MTKRNLHLALDIDDTFMDFIGVCQAALTTHTGQSIPRDQWHTYDLSLMYNIPRPELMDVMHNHRLLETAQPLDGAHELMLYIAANNIRLSLVTARGWHKQGDQLTRASMATYFPFVEYQLTVFDYGVSKVSAFTPDDPPQLMFDDSATVCDDMAKHYPNCAMYMIRQPHNAHARHLHKSVNLSEALTILMHMHRTHNHEPQEATAN
jgi:hypothetical protein